MALELYDAAVTVDSEPPRPRAAASARPPQPSPRLVFVRARLAARLPHRHLPSALQHAHRVAPGLARRAAGFVVVLAIAEAALLGLCSYSDRAAQEKLGLFREQRLSA